MTKTCKGYDKIISVFFRKAYVGLKSSSCITILPSLVVSSVASESEDLGFESHAILLKTKQNKTKQKQKKKKKPFYITMVKIYQYNHFIRM